MLLLSLPKKKGLVLKFIAGEEKEESGEEEEVVPLSFPYLP